MSLCFSVSVALLLCSSSFTGHPSSSSSMQLTPLSPSEFQPPSEAKHLITAVFGDVGMEALCHGIMGGSSSSRSNRSSVHGDCEGKSALSPAMSAALSPSQSLLLSAMPLSSQQAAAAAASVALAALTLHLRRLKVKGGPSHV